MPIRRPRHSAAPSIAKNRLHLGAGYLRVRPGIVNS
jgi:hypothetical protein